MMPAVTRFSDIFAPVAAALLGVAQRIVHCYTARMNYVDANSAEDLRDGAIKLHGPDGFEGMRKAGRLAAECLDMLVPMVKPGVTTAALDKAAFEFVVDNGAVPACLGYRGYQHTVCTSVNHVVCHGIPSDKPLKNGDSVNIDVTVIVDGWHGDTSRMYPVGAVDRKTERLINITYASLMLVIAAVKLGNTTGDIGHAIQKFAAAARAGVGQYFCGHGLVRLFTVSPNILNF